jgi:transcriptional antiterminator Rof (Rho-off)
VPGPVAASAPHHLKLIDELEDGATLKEQARDIWRLTAINGEVSKVSGSTVFSLLSKGMLEEQP